MNKLFKFLFHRVVFVGLFLIIQAVILITMIIKFNDYFVFFYGFCIVLSLCTVLKLVNENSNPAYKIAWIIPIMTLPIFGGLLYLLFGGNKLSLNTRKKMDKVKQHMDTSLEKNEDLICEIYSSSSDAGVQSRYIQNCASCPPYKNTYSEFLPMGEVKFTRMLEELEKAEHYIFLEYFIVQEGKMWNSILDILVEKAKLGVDVRVIYDDVGCLFTLPYGYNKKLEAMGIKCSVFNPFIPVLTSKLNNRDHRKICVIDGHTGITGGINLADEYINEFEKHGHWKDCSILLKGEAVWSLTVMFLSVWDYINNINEDFSMYKPNVYAITNYHCSGYVQPYNDSPLDDEIIGESVYMNIINKSKKYVYISTPYLIVDNEMVTSLTTAAKSGIDIRIMTPHVPDKKFVHAVTRAYYEVLIESGVKIYEYTPGFNHAKTFVSDDEIGTVGTINLDYRSLYLHFECGTWLYGTDSIIKMKEDYLKTLEVCQLISLEECKNVSLPRKLIRSVLRAFAPLM